MKTSTRSVVLSLACGLSVLGLVGRANAATLELVFLLDGSTSISDKDYGLQLEAYRSVFNNETFYRQIIKPVGTLAVSVLQFGFSVVQEVNWTTINSFADAQAFGDLFTLNEMPKLNQTSSKLGTAIQYATFGDGSTIKGVFNNGIQGDRLILDPGTDGFFAGGLNPVTAANDARTYAQQNNLSFVINAISPTANYSRDLYDPTRPPDKYIIGGVNNNGRPAFVEVADNPIAYEASLCNKIRREVNPNANGNPCAIGPQSVPESNSLFGVLTMAILGLGSQVKKLMKGH